MNYPTLMALAFFVRISNFNALRDREGERKFPLKEFAYTPMGSYSPSNAKSSKPTLQERFANVKDIDGMVKLNIIL
ncbi:MAG: hypothetical protein KME08_17915 [Aphanothece sp. CMT-3BRIN-NPC111]|nr:hypothetical protein [Aphanothece sp. CMT-3BRIN-NPC111]